MNARRRPPPQEAQTAADDVSSYFPPADVLSKEMPGPHVSQGRALIQDGELSPTLSPVPPLHPPAAIASAVSVSPDCRDQDVPLDSLSKIFGRLAFQEQDVDMVAL